MTKRNKTFKIVFVLLAVLVLVMSSTVFAFADGEYSTYDDNQYAGNPFQETETGYDLVYQPILELYSAYFQPLMALLLAIGMVYAVVLGVKFAKAEDPQEREKVKAFMKNLIIGFIALFVIYGTARWFMPVFSQFAAQQTDNLDRQNLYNKTGDESTAEATVDIYAVDRLRNQDSDDNYAAPTITYNTVTGGDEYSTPAEGDGGGGTSYDSDGNVNGSGGSSSGSSSSSSTGDGTGSSSTVDLTTLTSELSTATTDFEQKLAKYVANPEGSEGNNTLYSIALGASKTVETKLSALQTALGSNLAEGNTKIEIDRANVALQSFKAKVAEEEEELKTE